MGSELTEGIKEMNLSSEEAPMVSNEVIDKLTVAAKEAKFKHQTTKGNDLSRKRRHGISISPMDISLDNTQT